MNFLFLMDPLETVNVDKDTTLMFMLESARRKHKVYYLSNNGISRKNGQTLFDVVQVVPSKNRSQTFQKIKCDVLSEDHVDAVFIRTDPPFDDQYLINTFLLDLVSPNVTVINDPRAVRTVNEKIWGSQFEHFVPPTLISSQKHQLLKFINEQKNIIAKPTHGHGGKGVFHLKQGDTNINVALELLSNNFKQHIILQKYIPQSKIGDKRILLLNGEPLGAIMRVHSRGEHRNNLFAGGSVAKAKITTRDKKIIDTLRPHLVEMGLYFVGIDILGDYLIEVNVTSPTCLQETNRLYNLTLERDVIDFVEKLIEENKSQIRMKR